MKELIKDYERRLKTVNAKLEEDDGDFTNFITTTKLATQASCYIAFIIELKRELNELE